MGFFPHAFSRMLNWGRQKPGRCMQPRTCRHLLDPRTYTCSTHLTINMNINKNQLPQSNDQEPNWNWFNFFELVGSTARAKMMMKQMKFCHMWDLQSSTEVLIRVIVVNSMWNVMWIQELGCEQPVHGVLIVQLLFNCTFLRGTTSGSDITDWSHKYSSFAAG